MCVSSLLQTLRHILAIFCGSQICQDVLVKKYQLVEIKPSIISSIIVTYVLSFGNEFIEHTVFISLTWFMNQMRLWSFFFLYNYLQSFIGICKLYHSIRWRDPKTAIRQNGHFVHLDLRALNPIWWYICHKFEKRIWSLPANLQDIVMRWVLQ